MRPHVILAVLSVSFVACSSAEDDASGPRVIVYAAGGAASGAAGSTSVAGMSGASGHGGEPPAAGGGAGSAGTGGQPTGGSGTAGVGTGGAAGGGGMSGAGGSGAGASGAAGSSGAAAASGTGGAAGSGGASCAGVELPAVITFQLASAPYPSSDHPSVAVHVPPGFRPCDHPGAIVFFHGFDNCVENVIGSVDTPCEPGGPARSALHLADQLDAAQVNAMLIAVQLAYDQSTGDPGALAKPGSLHALLHELFSAHLSAMLGMPWDVEDLDRVVLASHSGGYWATAMVLENGMVPQITEVDLYDSLYAYQSTFEGFLTDHITSFDASVARPYRFVDIYTSGGGTLADSQSMASDTKSALDAAGLSASLLDDETTATLVDMDFDHPVIFKHSALAHNDVPRYYLQKLAPHSGFSPL